MSDFHIRLHGDDLLFAASHFITFENGMCERLHGHTFRATAEIFGPLNKSRYVADFIAVRRAFQEILAELDHRTLLPTQHASISIERRSDEVEATFGSRRWVFPTDDCVLLPVANTTSEALAEYIAKRLADVLGSSGRINIEIDEGDGNVAICEIGGN
jgi:6-pyruvoyltetrahydropterin/6-carboxytetrahydropterin synthase